MFSFCSGIHRHHQLHVQQWSSAVQECSGSPSSSTSSHFLTECSVSVLVSTGTTSSTCSSGHLQSRNALEVHHLQHLLGFGIHLDDILFQSRDIWDIVVSSLPLFLLQLDGDASHGGPLESLHEVSDKPGNLVAERLGGDEGDLLNDPLVGMEVECKLCVIFLNNYTSCLLDSFGPDTSHGEELEGLL